MSTETVLKQTPLFETYKKYGAKVIDFGGGTAGTVFQHFRRT
jgi:hypothetical protein